MWQLHRLEVDAVPPTSYECGHITWKWAKSHTDQASTTYTHTHARRGNAAAMSRAATATATASVSRGMQIRECLWVNIFGCARAADLTPFGGFGLGRRQIKPVSNALSSQQGCICCCFSLFFFLSALSAAANEFLRSVGDVRCAYRYICIFADSCALAYSILVQQCITQMQNTQMQNMKCIKYSIVKY